MSQPPRNNNRRRRSPAKRRQTVDFWHGPNPLPEVAPINAPHDAGALLRSLGDPPIFSGNAVGHYFTAVIERAAAVAMALTLSADLLADAQRDDSH